MMKESRDDMETENQKEAAKAREERKTEAGRNLMEAANARVVGPEECDGDDSGVERKRKKRSKIINHGAQFEGELDHFNVALSRSDAEQVCVDRERVDVEREKVAMDREERHKC